MAITGNQNGCPNCGRLDAVRKVSAVYDEGTSKSRYSGSTAGLSFGGGGTTTSIGAVSLSGFSQSQLSMRMAPPAAPRRTRWGCLPLLGCALSVCGIVTALALFSALGISVTGNNRFPWPAADNIPIFAISLLLTACLLVLLWRRGATRKREYDQATKQHLQLIVMWQWLLYCGRCDGVFFPAGSANSLRTLAPTVQENVLFRVGSVKEWLGTLLSRPEASH